MARSLSPESMAGPSKPVINVRSSSAPANFKGEQAALPSSGNDDREYRDEDEYRSEDHEPTLDALDGLHQQLSVRDDHQAAEHFERPDPADGQQRSLQPTCADAEDDDDMNRAHREEHTDYNSPVIQEPLPYQLEENMLVTIPEVTDACHAQQPSHQGSQSSYLFKWHTCTLTHCSCR